jgi:hypothetical protein
MRNRSILALVLALAAGACAPADDTDAGMADDAAMEDDAGMMEDDPTFAPAGPATGLPEGYAMRLDREDAAAADFHVEQGDGSMMIRTGPAGILYNEEDVPAEGDYTVSGTFTEVGAPAGHREAYGLIIGGADLGGPAQQYTYFLVRGDGRYLIKQRAGAEMMNVTDGWQDSDVVVAAEEDGDVTNELSIAVRGDQAHFSVNGTEVAAFPTADLDIAGIAGVRVNHNLNVRVEDFSVGA